MAYSLFVCGVGKRKKVSGSQFSCVSLLALKDQQAMEYIRHHLLLLSPQLIKSPVPTVEEVEQVGTFCVNVAGSWHRAKLDGPLTVSDDQHDQFEVVCIDYGFKQPVKSLSFIRLFPREAEYLQNHPVLVSKFLLADVLIENQFQYKNYVKLYLETHIVNQLVQAVNLGYRDGHEIVRLYTISGLLAKSLLEKNLVVLTKTFKIAPQHLLPIDTANNSQVTLPVKYYTSSSLDLKKSTTVTVLSIENGVNYFTVFNKSNEIEYSRIQLKLHLERNNLRPLTAVRDGQACAILSARDGCMYRGLVQKEKNGWVSVYLVDVGTKESAQLPQLFQIPDYLLEKSIFTIRASLANAELFDEFEPEMVGKFFGNLVHSKVLTARVPNGSTSSPPQKVHLIDSDGCEIFDLLLHHLKIAKLFGTTTRICLEQ